MTDKPLNSDQLRREIIEAVIRLSSRTPLYSIRLEDISNFINEKYKLDEKSRYRTGSIMASLNKGIDSLLVKLEDSHQEIDSMVAKQIKALDDYLLRTKSEDTTLKRVGRWRRTTMWIAFLAFEYIWDKLSPMSHAFELNVHPIIKLRMISDYFITFASPQLGYSDEMMEGMREILILEGVIPIGTKMELPDGSFRWVEPINISLAKFTKSLDQLIKQLQEKEIFDKKYKVQATRQAIMGVVMWEAIGKIWHVRSDPSYIGGEKYYTADYSPEDSLEVIRGMLLGFCTEKGLKSFQKEWPSSTTSNRE